LVRVYGLVDWFPGWFAAASPSSPSANLRDKV
jgi:hypothetical protein